MATDQKVGSSNLLAHVLEPVGVCLQVFLCNKPARFLSPAEAVQGAGGFMQSGDVLVWASRGGKTDELFPILDICHKKSVTVIGITERL